MAKLTKEVHRLLRNIDSFSNGQATVKEWNPDCVEELTVQLAPTDGPYKGGRFDFQIRIDSSEYPISPPTVTCLTDIYHPNIDPTCDEGNICLNLFDEWTESFGLTDCIQGLLFLFYEPNTEDPLSPYFSTGLSPEEFQENVLKSLKGESFDDMSFARNWHCAEEVEKDIEVILENVADLKLDKQEGEDTISNSVDFHQAVVRDELEIADTVEISTHDNEDQNEIESTNDTTILSEASGGASLLTRQTSIKIEHQLSKSDRVMNNQSEDFGNVLDTADESDNIGRHRRYRLVHLEYDNPILTLAVNYAADYLLTAFQSNS